MAINEILEIGRQGLQTNKQAMQTTSNNIANANTPGFSRQRAVFQANSQSVNGGVRTGGGVEIKKVLRVHDSFVQNQILEEAKSFGNFKVQADGFKRLEGVLTNDGFRVGDLVNKFFSDAKELSANPETSTLRAAVANSAEATADGFRRLSDSMESLKQDMDGQLIFQVEDINNKTQELAALNASIFRFDIMGDDTNELNDRRDQVVRDLSQKLGYQAFSDDQGNVNIQMEGFGVLVNADHVSQLEVRRTPAHDDKSAGSLDLFVRDPSGSVRPVTKSLKEGELGGLVHIRDEVLNPSIAHLDRVAYQFGQAVNAAHRQGVGLDGQGERDMFSGVEEINGAARNLRLNEALRKNHEAIAVGGDVGLAGDNRVISQIADLQTSPILGIPIKGADGNMDVEARQTINESLNSLVGTVAVQSQRNGKLLEQQEAVVNQLDNYRQAVSGVNLEEEAVNMLQYQQVFNASAKAMKVGEELFNTILSIKE